MSQSLSLPHVSVAENLDVRGNTRLQGSIWVAVLKQATQNYFALQEK